MAKSPEAPHLQGMSLPVPNIDPSKLPRWRVRTEATVGVACALLVVLLGPRVAVDETVESMTVPADVDGWLASREAEVPDLRPGDGKTIVWADSMAERTPVSLVYLHGFSADPHEIDPVPRMLADSLGANLFYMRFTGHGRNGSAMGEATAQAWFQDMVEAVAVGRRLGDRVVLVGTSTGATLATWAAGHADLRDDIAAVALLSPNFHPRDPKSRILLWPWGRVLARIVSGPERCWEARNAEQERHWDTCYATEALLPMMGLVERVRTMDLEAVSTPALVLYSTDDEVVDPQATAELFGRLGSSPKRLVTFAGSSDPAQHILAGDIMSPGTNGEVVREVLLFLESAEIRP